jgi:hypothetical protein
MLIAFADPVPSTKRPPVEPLRKYPLCMGLSPNPTNRSSPAAQAVSTRSQQGTQTMQI